MSKVPPTTSVSVPGYRDIDPIFRSERTLVHSAVRIEGNQKVALKSVLPGTEDSNARWRLLHEYKLLSGLDIPHVVKAHSLKNTELGLTLELEHVGSSNLHLLGSEEVSIRRVLEIAIQLAVAVTALHAHDISHRDINPSNVMYHRTSGELWLIDFGLATELTRESAEALPSRRLEGTLGYLSPEQTGRMNRSVDRRTDFYSLGATIYQLLTNRPPFAIRDPMALLHATVALQPAHACEVRPEVPQVLGDLVMRLLHKDAEQRYQSGQALVDDLKRCLADLAQRGQVVSFELGTTDRRGKFGMPERLYGREAALATLGRALTRSLGGRRSVVGLPGKAGVGKSSLSRELLPKLKGSGLLAVGVCNPVRRSPYGPILEVFRAVTSRVLAGSQDDLAAHRARYDEAVEGHGYMLALLMPELAAIVGPMDAPPDVPQGQVRERILRMLTRLLLAYHDPEHPLVVFLDDLQWADPGTIEVIDRLLNSDADGGPLLLLAWREDEIPAGHPFAQLLARSGDLIEQIHIGPLTEDDVAQLLADALSLPRADVLPLAVRVHEKTAGNAFFVRQFLMSLAADGLLKFNPQTLRWDWSADAIDALPPTHNVGELLSRRLDALSEDARQVLGAAACLGKKFELPILAKVADVGREGLRQGLREAVQAGLVLAEGDVWTRLRGWSDEAEDSAEGEPLRGGLRFVHDSIYDAALGLPTPEERQAHHLLAGRMLLAVQRDQSDPFVVADQFIQAVALLDGIEEKRVVAQVCCDAGERAYGSAAYETALYYLEKATGLLQERDWDDAYDLTFRLHIRAAESLLMCPTYKASADYSAIAIRHARDVIDRVAVQRVRLRYHTGRYEFAEAIEVSLDALRSVGVSLPPRPHLGHVAWTLLKTYVRVWRMSLDKLRALPANDDQRVEAAMSLLVDSAAPSYYISTNLMPLILCKMVELSLKHGVSSHSAFGMAGFAFVQIMVRDDVKSATMWATFAYELLDRFDAKVLAPKVHVVARGIVEVRTQPLGSLIEPFRKSAWLAKETGDAEYMALCRFNASLLTMLAGGALAEAQPLCLEDLAIVEEVAQSQATNAVRNVLQAMDCLRGDAPDPAVLSGQYMDFDTMIAKLQKGGDKPGVHAIVMRQTFLSLLFGDTETLLRHIKHATEDIDKSPGSPDIGSFHFYAALGWVRHMRETAAVGGPPWKSVEWHLKVLRKWAEDGPANAAHKARLVEAEVADLLGKTVDAMRLYEEAVVLARASGMLHEEAMCLEWSARASLRYGYHRNAAMLVREAITAWRVYGCGPKVVELAGLQDAVSEFSGSTHPISSPGSLSLGSMSISSSQGLDVGSVLKAAQAVSGEIEIDALLDRLMRVIIENAGATSGFLVLQRGDRQIVVASVSTGQGEEVAVEILDPADPIEPGDFYPEALGVVNYVTNSLEHLVLHDAVADLRFFNDVEECPHSVLCVPALKGKVLVGVMYLENTLTRNAFSQGRHEIVTVVCSQAAVSIENALLYGDLQQSLDKQTALTNAYGRFMPPQFLKLLAKDSILDLQRGDQILRPITVMFADIRNFTGMAEAIGPARTFTFINRYLGHMEPAIHAHHGFVNQYLGDGIMALFPRSADDAVLAALTMLRAVRELNKELAAEGDTPVEIGIGLNGGPLMVGAIGGLDRMGRGVVGDATNVASRVEGMTKRYRTPLLIGESTFLALDKAEVTTRLVDRVMPKGRESAMFVYEVLEAADPISQAGKIQTLADYERGVAHWSEGRFHEAEVYFNAVVAAFPGDTAAQLFAARCKHLANN